MSSAKTLLVITAGFVAYNLMSKGNAAGNLNFFPDRIKSFSLDGVTPEIQAYIRVQNTSNTPLTLRSVAGNVLNNNVIIGNVEDFTPIVVPANYYGLIHITIRLLWLTVINALYEIWNGNKALKDTITFNAYANIDGLPQQSFTLNFAIG